MKDYLAHATINVTFNIDVPTFKIDTGTFNIKVIDPP
jgi:hypothetical protein